MYTLQERMIFFPSKLAQNYPFPHFHNFEEHFFTVDATTKLHALHFKTEHPKGIILYFHGNTRAIDDWGFAAQQFTSYQWDVFMPDYRSYGKSTGTLSEAGIHADASLFYDFLKKKYPERQIIIYGRSLGTGVATELAMHHKPKLLVLETPFLSLLESAKGTAPFLPLKLLLKYPFRNDLKIAKITCPIHIIHGTEDELIPLDHAQKLYELAGDNAQLTIVENGMHNNLSDFDAFQSFIRKLLQ